ncbi:glycosylphosphatidylinositol anchor attachment 1 protein-like [Gossypium australe]|uniref:Glycosylphosphatidylinositol anchor attachment 1 protein-like n=1 Tax=Gossypium australe TaxID=47621 RepID=A0A5B6V5C0_9ROSI|nr:glycosylphosphatidylinositol anchor attachment 1 protein-like [Gossypium australe]
MKIRLNLESTCGCCSPKLHDVLEFGCFGSQFVISSLADRITMRWYSADDLSGLCDYFLAELIQISS